MIFNKFELNKKNNIDVSVITVTYQSEKTLEETIISVIAQKMVNIEYIIIDGGSADKTVDIIKKYSEVIDCWISEEDNGIYDAMNKGIKIARGKWIAILNSDDKYIDEFALSQICEVGDKYDVVASPVLIKRDEDVKIFNIDHGRKLYKNIPYMHTGIFVKRCVYENIVGLFDLQYKIASDIDFIFRLIKNNVSFLELEKPFVEMKDGGASFKNYYRGRYEYAKAYIDNFGSPIKAALGFFATTLEFYLYHKIWLRKIIREIKKT
ncbi:glycosyltransferase family 2 protein [Macromonas bipunctata]|uniref:glycosyltransferase family 2 protein n=1 Tax=Macromonas bipunctata TaxID=183670 RepID=UPI000C33F30F|nr:glycosyltransferase family 2 protein [Macromonas bipunctata]